SRAHQSRPPIARGTYQICQSGQRSLSAATAWSAVLAAIIGYLLTSLQIVVRAWVGCSRSWLDGRDAASDRPMLHTDVAVELSPDAFARGGLADSPLVRQGFDEDKAES